MQQKDDSAMITVSTCKLCGSNANTTIYIRADGLPIQECTCCGFSFLGKRFCDAELKRFYDGSYFQSSKTYRNYFHCAQALVELDYCPRLQRLGNHITSWQNKKILEIGCAAGSTLAVLKSRGASVKGIEISKDAITFGQTQFGVDIFHGTLDHFPAKPEEFDVILAFDVLEHVPDPGKMICKIKSLLKTGGIFAFSVPNFDRFFNDDKKWIGVESYFEHIGYFRNDVMKSFLEKVGFFCLDHYTFTTPGRNGNLLSKMVEQLRVYSSAIRSAVPCVNALLRMYRRVRFDISGQPSIDIRRDETGMDIFGVYKTNQL